MRNYAAGARTGRGDLRGLALLPPTADAAPAHERGPGASEGGGRGIGVYSGHKRIGRKHVIKCVFKDPHVLA